MTQVFAKQGRSLLALVAVLAIAVAACGSSESTQAPGSSAAPGGQESASTEPGGNGGNGGGGDLSGAGEAFANIDSYRFKMTVLDPRMTAGLSAMSGISGDEAVAISGIVIVKPEPAYDIAMPGVRIIMVGGTTYMNMGGMGFIATPAGASGVADAFIPAAMYDDLVTGGGMDDFAKVGSGEKNGVNADHYQAGSEALAAISMNAPNLEGATWTADVWIATDGGYPVNVSLVATKDGKAVWEVVMDVTNVNDPSNKVEAPKTAL
jgi:hypothetical protein